MALEVCYGGQTVATMWIERNLEQHSQVWVKIEQYLSVAVRGAIVSRKLDTANQPLGSPRASLSICSTQRNNTNILDHGGYSGKKALWPSSALTVTCCSCFGRLGPGKMIHFHAWIRSSLYTQLPLYLLLLRLPVQIYCMLLTKHSPPPLPFEHLRASTMAGPKNAAQQKVM